MQHEWLFYLVILVLAFFSLDAGFSFFTFLLLIALVLFISTKYSTPPSRTHEPEDSGEKPIILEAHHDTDSGPGRMGRMNYVMVSHKYNIQYTDYFNANLGAALDNIGRGIADLLSGPLHKEEGEKKKESEHGGGH